MPRQPHPSPVLLLCLILTPAAFLTGCRSAPPASDAAGSEPLAPATQPALEAGRLTEPRWVEPVRATCAPPAAWSAEPLKVTNLSKHQVWISPGGSTAYGAMVVSHALLPLASDERILGEFLDGMRKTEGSAELLEKKADPQLAGGVGGIRFIAKGGRYTVRANVASRGRYAWVWYAGTLTGQPVNEAELVTAAAAREKTVIEPAVRR